MSSNYILGDTVKLAIQVTENSIPLLDISNPKVERVIFPNGKKDGKFPQSMKNVDSEFGVYAYDYIPEYVGDYIVIFTFILEGIQYSTMEHFTVSLGYSGVVPKAKAPKAVAR